MWLTIGISGVSCAGKTTLANGIRDRLQADARVTGRVELLHQDAYFHPIDSPLHVWIPDLRHINRERLGALDIARLDADIRDVLASNTDTAANDTLNILIVEGHLIFSHPPIDRLLDVRLCLDIPFAECAARRSRRRYPQPTPAGYFERFVWPLYGAHRAAFVARARGRTFLWCSSSQSWQPLQQQQQQQTGDHHNDDDNDDDKSSADDDGVDYDYCNRQQSSGILHVLSGNDDGDDETRSRCLDVAMHAISARLPGMPNNDATTGDSAKAAAASHTS